MISLVFFATSRLRDFASSREIMVAKVKPKEVSHLAKPMDAATTVRVLGWTYLSLAGLTILAGAVPLFFPRSLGAGGGIGEMLADAPGAFRIISVLLAHQLPLVLSQTALALFMIVAGVQFLRRRAWARAALEVVTWLSLSGVTILAVVWYSCWMGLARLYAEGGQAFSPQAHLVMAGVGLLVLLLWSAPHLVLIGLLRGRTVREAMIGRRLPLSP